MTTHFTCPHCGCQASTDEEVYALDLDNGCPVSYFPAKDLAAGRERHIDSRYCCQDCWEEAGRVAKMLGQPHPYSGTAVEARRAAAAVGSIIGAPARRK